MKFATLTTFAPATAAVDTLLVGVFEGELLDLKTASEATLAVVQATNHAARTSGFLRRL